ncbi:g11261 [Coccomyxa elongata]
MWPEVREQRPADLQLQVPALLAAISHLQLEEPQVAVSGRSGATARVTLRASASLDALPEGGILGRATMHQAAQVTDPDETLPRPIFPAAGTIPLYLRTRGGAWNREASNVEKS